MFVKKEFFHHRPANTKLVPNNKLKNVDAHATINETIKALPISGECKRFIYHFKEKPVHFILTLDSLKENNTKTNMGKYKNM